MTDAHDHDDTASPEQIESDVQALIEWCMAAAVERWNGHLVPFAAGLGRDGEIVEVTTAGVHVDAAESNAIIELTAALRPRLSELRAAAIAYRTDYDEQNDAIELSFEHRAGIARHIRRPFPKTADSPQLGALESRDAPGAIWLERPRAG